MFRAKLRTLVCKPPVNCSVTHKPLDNKNNGTCYDCYQFVIKRLIEIAETRINTGFFKQLDLFTITKDSLTDILDSTISDFYSLTVNYVSVNDLDSLEIKSDDGDHTVDVVRETAKAEDEEESDTDTDTSDESSADVDSSDETTSDTTTTSYELDGEELDESAFTTFYNKLINMTAQERLTEEYTPDGEAAYTFLFKDTDGNETTAEYYEYDTNFYAAVVGDKVYLVNKMNVKELNDAYQDMINPDTEDAETTDTEDESTEEN